MNPHVDGRKDDSKKLRWTLLPIKEVEEVIKVLEFGAVKYKENNWQKVEDGEQRYLNAAYRHLSAINKGERLDRETGYRHYAHAICSLLFACWHSTRRKKHDRNR